MRSESKAVGKFTRGGSPRARMSSCGPEQIRADKTQAQKDVDAFAGGLITSRAHSVASSDGDSKVTA
jgi:hypothetical protein